MHKVTHLLELVPENCPLNNNGQCAVVNEMGRRHMELEQRAVTDELTGLWNRAHFNALVRHDLERSLRHRRCLSLVLVDIDCFKHINDHFGHQVGDRVLREMAELIRDTVGKADTVFRWGGEEFAVLASEVGHRGAAHLAERLRACVAAHSFGVAGTLTISLGVAEHLGHEDIEAWFQRADAMLYVAKHGGRNQVRVDACGNSDLWAAEHGASPLHLVWHEVYESGHAAIDADHRELFERANILMDIWLSGLHEQADILQACGRLMEHIVAHFHAEEAVLAQVGFCGLEAHQHAHEGLLRRAEQLHREVANGSCSLGAMLEFLVGDVIARHVFGPDREFFPLFSN